MGQGYSWITDETIREELRTGTLKPLPLATGVERSAPVHLAFADPEFPGRDAVRLADIIRKRVKAECDSMSR
jgi:hypothetical protein